MKGGEKTVYYIYKIENLINHKIYIGLTNNIERRRARHFTDLKYNRHQNSFLQKEYNIFGKENFSFNIEFQGDVSYEDISEKEKEYIKLYDSYKNGYNQNEGGNFGPSNGGTHLTESDLLNILSALEFMSRPGQILSNMFEVSKTTISRIKHGVNHIEAKEKYDKMPLDERKKIYEIFCESTNFYKNKVHTTILASKRKLSRAQVYTLYVNEQEGRIIPLKTLGQLFNLRSGYAPTAILKGEGYKDYQLDFQNITENDRNQIVSLLRNWQSGNPLNCGELLLSQDNPQPSSE